MNIENINNLFKYPLDRFFRYIINISPFVFQNIFNNFLILIIIIFVLWLVVTQIIKLIILFNHLKEEKVYLEITPPKDTEISAVSTTQLFILISGLLKQRLLINKILLRQSSISFEIVSSKKSGIKYILSIPNNLVDTIEKNLYSYIPGIKIKRVSDYLTTFKNSNNKIKIIEFKLSKHFSLPINEQSDLKHHDPLAYLTGNMSKLDNDEMLAMQIILQPISRLTHFLKYREIKKLQSAINLNKYIDWEYNSKTNTIARSIIFLINLIINIVMIPLDLLTEIITGHPIEKLEQLPEKKKVNPAVNEIEDLVKSKIFQPLLSSTIRVLICVKDDQVITREQGIKSSFTSFLHTSGQSIIAKWILQFSIFRYFLFWKFKRRISGDRLYLAPSEISALYHFPFESSSHIEDLIRIKSRELPTPLSLKNSFGNLDLLVGVNNFAGESLPIGLTLSQRQKHMYVIGKTGTGKTTLLTNAIYQDMNSGKGLAVFDPHGDMLQELLRVVPKHRRKDVIVFDPSDRDFPIGLNLLSPGVSFTNKEDEREWISSSVISVFAKITAKEYWGPRMEHILRNATLTALQLPNPSLYTLQRLLTDKSFQKKAAANISDPVLKQFWNKEFSLLGTMQLSSATAPLTQRLGHFITSKMSRHILLQEKSTINMSQIMNKGKILLVNLSKGDLGEDQSFFFGTVLTSIIWMAAYQRTKIPEKQRRDFFLYIDEFQNFATSRFSEITSEGRKFHISLTASHQNIAQVDDINILKVVAGNANNIICLKASPDDEKFILPFMEPEVEKGDIVNLPPFHFYMKIANENSENAFSGQTVPLDVKALEKTKIEVINTSRKKYSTARKVVEKYLDILFSGQIDKDNNLVQKKKKGLNKFKQKIKKVKI